MRAVTLASAPQAAPERRPDRHKTAGQRLLEAFEAVDRFPVFAGAREALRKPGADTVALVESDLALTMTVLREANRGPGRTRIATVPDALDRIGDLGVHAIVASADTFDFFDDRRDDPW